MSDLIRGTGVAQLTAWSTSLLRYVALVVNADGELVTTVGAAGGGLAATVAQGLGGVSPWLVTGPLTDIQLRASAVPISAASLPLPSGASTAVLQTQPGVDIGDVTINNSTGGAAVNVQDGGNSITVDGAVTANAGTNLNTSALALEAGHLATIDGKVPALGQALAAGSVPIVLTAIQQTALTPPAAITGYALEAGHLAAIDTSAAKIPSQGQALAANSVPVVLTALQQTALTPPAAIAGFALEAGHLATIDSRTPALGQALAAASVPVILPSATITTLTPPAAIAGFALEAGHLATIDSHIPALGQALAAASVPVILPSATITTLTPPAAIAGFALEAGHLATIDTSTAKIPSQGQALAAASLPVVLTAIQQTALTPPAAITGFALEAGHLAAIDSHTPALGQALAASSVPVVLTAAQLITLTPPTTQAVDQTKVNGTAVSVNAGTVDAGTQRVVVATDQAAFPINARLNDSTGSGIASTFGALNVWPYGSTGAALQQDASNVLKVALYASGVAIDPLGKAEDAAAVSGDVGISQLAVRQDGTPVVDTSNVGDYASTKVDREGRLWINSDVLGSKLDQLVSIMQILFVESRLQTEVLAQGLNVMKEDLDNFRDDPYFAPFT